MISVGHINKCLAKNMQGLQRAATNGFRGASPAVIVPQVGVISPWCHHDLYFLDMILDRRTVQ